MAHKALAVALGMIAAASPALASNPPPARPWPSPADSPDTRYCMRIEPLTGSRIELLRCWTRAEWAEQGVDVDKDWAREGVRIIR